MTRDEIVEMTGDDEMLFADGLDDAIMGVVWRCGAPNPVVCYSIEKCIENLTVDMDRDEAEEYFWFNTAGAYVGDYTPVFLDDRIG